LNVERGRERNRKGKRIEYTVMEGEREREREREILDVCSKSSCWC